MVYGLIMILLVGMTDGVTVDTTDSSSDFRAVWVSSVFNLDFPTEKNLSVDEMKKEADDIIAKSVKLGLNAIILQVRPCADALYKSEIFPWSEYLTGVQGVAPADGFDPLEYWIEKAHANGMELHAWINPYRITTSSPRITSLDQLSATNPARLNPSRAVQYNNAFYFDPGLPENKKLIIDGVAEIVKNYNVDGIHLDDYFYPGPAFNDDATYAQYGGGKNKDDWRRENVNAVIKGIYTTVKELNPNVRVGVSPFAIWQNSSSTPLGSDTNGFESYKSIYSDSRKWVLEGWLDYICPQIYWYIGNEAADYQKLLKWWADLCEGTNVDLYIGHAAYKESENQSGWSGEIIRQLEMNEDFDVVKGSVFFRSSNLVGRLGEQLKNYYNATVDYSETQNIPEFLMDTLTVAQPSTNVSVTDATGYMIFGTCDPSKDLYINGALVTDKTLEGFFSIYVELEKGENVFTFSQEGQTSVSRTITVNEATVVPLATMDAPTITNAFPAVDEYVSVGDTVLFRCTAPVGATVTVTINGETFNLTDNNSNRTYPENAEIYSTTYSYRYTVTDCDTVYLTDLGTPSYSMTYRDNSYSVTAPGQIIIIGKDAPYYATVSAETAWLFPQAGTTGGSAWQVLRGQKDRVTAISGGTWVRLANGRWVTRQSVTLALEDTLQNNVLSDGIYFTSENTDALIWKASAYPAINVEYDGKNVTVTFGMHTEIPAVEFLADGEGIFSDIQSGYTNGAPYYKFTIRDDVNIEGYYIDFSDGEFRLNFKKRKSLNDGDFPLSGFNFMIDAGHGLTDTGAVGPMGTRLTEKDINLINAVKLYERLTTLGATVSMVRDTDVFYSLQERVEMSRVINPDMFISIHANSMVETSNSTDVRGLTIWHRNANSVPLAETLLEYLYEINPMTTRHKNINQANFYVCRPAWTPSVIIETSFMCNIDDYSWLINSTRQDELADRIVDAIFSYYSDRN